MDCPRCNLPVGGKTFGGEAERYASELRKARREGEEAALLDASVDWKSCPYDEDKHAALYNAWLHGVYYTKYALAKKAQKEQT